MNKFKFHTKTIQSILNPVTHQISELCVLLEDGAGTTVSNDLMTPAKAVSTAMHHFIVIGKQTLESTKDEILRQEMPVAIDQAGEACKILLDACQGLTRDPSSKTHKKMLIDGGTGLLQGFSAVLLIHDQGDVRKMVKTCNKVTDYLKSAEVVQTSLDLDRFTSNLNPGFAQMSGQVRARQQDLTNASHASILEDELEQLERAFPLLLSSMKAFVSVKQERKAGGSFEAKENRNYAVLAMIESLKEIIRVLQLTSPTEEQGALASSTRGQQTRTLTAMVFEAKALLTKTGKDAVPNSDWILAIEYVLKEGKRMAKTLPSQRRTDIEKLCTEVDRLELEGLQAKEEGDAEKTKVVSKAICGGLDKLERALHKELSRMIVEDFKDPLGPLTAFSASTLASLGVHNRAQNYTTSSESFQMHTDKMAQTALFLAQSGVIKNRRQADNLVTLARKVKALAPNVIYASKVVFENPHLEAAREHFKMEEADYQSQVKKLTNLVDGGVDTLDFIAVSEENLKDDLEKALTKALTAKQAAFAHVTSAAHTAIRVVAVTRGEAENSTDEKFKAKLVSSSVTIDSAIGPMVSAARAAITQHSNLAEQQNFDSTVHTLVSAVHIVYEVVNRQYNPPQPQPRAQSRPRPIPRPRTLAKPEPNKAEDPIGFAAHQLDKDAKQWENNAMVEAARKMAKLMMQMAKYKRSGDVESAIDLIQVARQIDMESEEVVQLARTMSEACTDKRLKRVLLEVVDKIPSTASQLKIIATMVQLKSMATSTHHTGPDDEGSKTLASHAENLASAVREALHTTETASLRVHPGEREKLSINWVKRSQVM